MKTIFLTITLILTSVNAFSHEPASSTDSNDTVKYWILDTSNK